MIQSIWPGSFKIFKTGEFEMHTASVRLPQVLLCVKQNLRQQDSIFGYILGFRKTMFIIIIYYHTLIELILLKIHNLTTTSPFETYSASN